MELSSIYDILFSNKTLSIPAEEMDKVEQCYGFLKDFVTDKVIYGINTGFGQIGRAHV